jgi:hypothetical protein
MGAIFYGDDGMSGPRPPEPEIEEKESLLDEVINITERHYETRQALIRAKAIETIKRHAARGFRSVIIGRFHELNLPDPNCTSNNCAAVSNAEYDQVADYLKNEGFCVKPSKYEEYIVSWK